MQHKVNYNGQDNIVQMLKFLGFRFPDPTPRKEPRSVKETAFGRKCAADLAHFQAMEKVADLADYDDRDAALDRAAWDWLQKAK